MFGFGKKWKGNTFKPIDLDVAELMTLDYATFVTTLRQQVADVKSARFDWYEQQEINHSSVNNIRGWMVLCGALAGFLTAIAVGLRFNSSHVAWLRDGNWDIVLLTVAVVLYAVMGMLAFIEKGGEDAGGYFRSIMAVIAIRDLWTAYQFKDCQLQLELGTPTGPQAVAAAKKRWLDEAMPFTKALDAISTQELTEWRGAFQAAMTQLSGAAATGLAAAQSALAEASKANAAAARPASLNLTVSYTAAGTAVVKIDGATVASGTQRTFAKADLPQGEHTVRVEIQDAAGAVAKSAEKVVLLAAGINELTLTPS